MSGPEGDIAGIPDLAVVVAPGSISAVSADRRVLTLTEAIAGDRARAAGEQWGAAFVITPADGWLSVRVTNISTDGQSITVDGIPRHLNPTGGTLQWAAWWSTFSAADVASEVRRDLTWSVLYTPLGAGTADGEGEAYDDGRVLVVVRPFSTGLTDRGLRASYPDLAATTPGRDNTRGDVIQAAGDELTLLLVPHLAPRGLHLDQIDGRPFAPAHAALAAALVVERQEPERAEKLRERAGQLVEQAVQCAWHDLDGDGEVDEGEGGQRATISLAATRLSTLFPRTHPRPTDPRWYRGRSH